MNTNSVTIAQQILNEHWDSVPVKVISEQQFLAEVKRIQGLIKRFKDAKPKMQRTKFSITNIGGTELNGVFKFSLWGKSEYRLRVSWHERYGPATVEFGGFPDGWNREFKTDLMLVSFHEKTKDPLKSLKKISIKHVQDLVDKGRDHPAAAW